MATVAADALSEVVGVLSVFQHFVVIICFEESGIALAEVPYYMGAWGADIGEYAYPYSIAIDDKAVRVYGIVQFLESRNRKAAEGYRHTCIEAVYQVRGWLCAAVAESCCRDEDGYVVAATKYFHAVDMVGMLVGDEDGAYFVHLQAEAAHTFFGFLTRYARIYEDSFGVVADVVAITIAA
jgi:hypothetical protein